MAADFLEQPDHSLVTTGNTLALRSSSSSKKITLSVSQTGAIQKILNTYCKVMNETDISFENEDTDVLSNIVFKPERYANTSWLQYIAYYFWFRDQKGEMTLVDVQSEDITRADGVNPMRFVSIINALRDYITEKCQGSLLSFTKYSSETTGEIAYQQELMQILLLQVVHKLLSERNLADRMQLINQAQQLIEAFKAILVGHSENQITIFCNVQNELLDELREQQEKWISEQLQQALAAFHPCLLINTARRNMILSAIPYKLSKGIVKELEELSSNSSSSVRISTFTDYIKTADHECMVFLIHQITQPVLAIRVLAENYMTNLDLSNETDQQDIIHQLNDHLNDVGEIEFYLEHTQNRSENFVKAFTDLERAHRLLIFYTELYLKFSKLPTGSLLLAKCLMFHDIHTFTEKYHEQLLRYQAKASTLQATIQVEKSNCSNKKGQWYQNVNLNLFTQTFDDAENAFTKYLDLAIAQSEAIQQAMRRQTVMADAQRFRDQITAFGRGLELLSRVQSEERLSQSGLFSLTENPTSKQLVMSTHDNFTHMEEDSLLADWKIVPIESLNEKAEADETTRHSEDMTALRDQLENANSNTQIAEKEAKKAHQKLIHRVLGNCKLITDPTIANIQEQACQYDLPNTKHLSTFIEGLEHIDGLITNLLAQVESVHSSYIDSVNNMNFFWRWFTGRGWSGAYNANKHFKSHWQGTLATALYAELETHIANALAAPFDDMSKLTEGDIQNALSTLYCSMLETLQRHAQHHVTTYGIGQLDNNGYKTHWLAFIDLLKRELERVPQTNNEGSEAGSSIPTTTLQKLNTNSLLANCQFSNVFASYVTTVDMPQRETFIQSFAIATQSSNGLNTHTKLGVDSANS